MVHGQRDWSNIGAEATVAGLSDMAELAARLGSPVTFNREGSILLIDTFESGHSRWELTGIAPYEAKISSEWARYGAYSLKFNVDANAAKYALMDTYFPYPVAGRYGVEFSMSINANIGTVHVDLRFLDGAERQTYALYLYPIAEQLKIWDRDLGIVTIVDPLPVHPSPWIWHTLKFVVNMDSQYYQRIILDGSEYDLTAYRPTVYATDTAPHAFLRMQFHGYATGAGVVYVDDVLITQNEP